MVKRFLRVTIGFTGLIWDFWDSLRIFFGINSEEGFTSEHLKQSKIYFWIDEDCLKDSFRFPLALWSLIWGFWDPLRIFWIKSEEGFTWISPLLLCPENLLGPTPIICYPPIHFRVGGEVIKLIGLVFESLPEFIKSRSNASAFVKSTVFTHKLTPVIQKLKFKCY